MLNNKTEKTAEKFYQDASEFVKGYVIDGQTITRPMLKVSLQGEIYFYHGEEKVVLAMAERNEFEKTYGQRFDYHYEIRDYKPDLSVHQTQ